MADTRDDEPPLRPVARPEDLGTDDLAQAGPRRPEPRPEGLGATVPEETLAQATEPGALDVGETALIGLMSGPEGGAALLRLPGGAVVKVAAGAQVAGGRVTAISEDGLRLLRGGEEIILTMPG